MGLYPLNVHSPPLSDEGLAPKTLPTSSPRTKRFSWAGILAPDAVIRSSHPVTNEIGHAKTPYIQPQHGNRKVGPIGIGRGVPGGKVSALNCSFEMWTSRVSFVLSESRPRFCGVNLAVYRIAQCETLVQRKPDSYLTYCTSQSLGDKWL